MSEQQRKKRLATMTETMARGLPRREEVEERFGLSRSWIYCEMRAGRFPEPVRIGQRAVRWLVSNLDEWAASRPVAQGEIGHRRAVRRQCRVRKPSSFPDSIPVQGRRGD